jgi:hypothetical protein
LQQMVFGRVAFQHAQELLGCGRESGGSGAKVG